MSRHPTSERPPWLWSVAAATLAVSASSGRFWALKSTGWVALNPVKPLLALVQPIALSVLCWVFARYWCANRRRRGHVWLIAALLFGFAAAISMLHPYFDRAELRALGLGSDVDDAFIVAAGNTIRWRNPYADPIYTGNPISPGPGWLILNALFGFRTLFFLLAPVHAALFAWAVWRAARNGAAAVLALLISLASTGLWESAFGGDLAAVGFAMAWATLLCVEWRARAAAVLMLAVLIGAIATARLPFVLYPALVALVLWRSDAPRTATVVGLVGTTVAILLHVTFWSMQPGSYPPFHLVGHGTDILGPTGLIVAVAFTGVFGVLAWRAGIAEPGEVMFWQGLGLVAPFVVVSAGVIIGSGFTLSGRLDWAHYMVPAIPSLAAAAAIAACPRPRGNGA